MLSWLGPLVGLLATGLGAWIGKRIITPKDHERAALLDTIAAGAASYIAGAYPGKPWAELVQLVIQRISTAAGLPTTNSTAIENAAALALARLGKGPGASK